MRFPQPSDGSGPSNQRADRERVQGSQRAVAARGGEIHGPASLARGDGAEVERGGVAPGANTPVGTLLVKGYSSIWSKGAEPPSEPVAVRDTSARSENRNSTSGVGRAACSDQNS